MEKGGWAPQAARRELGNFLLSSALLLGTARAQGRRLPVLPSAICLFPSGVCPERRVGLRARRGWVERVLVQRGCAGTVACPARCKSSVISSTSFHPGHMHMHIAGDTKTRGAHAASAHTGRKLYAL